MGVISVKENTRLNPSSMTVDELNYTAQATRVFDVIFTPDTNAVSQQILALTAGGIPPLWDPHPDDTFMYVQSKSQQYISADIRQVTVDYARVEEPLQQPAKISWTFSTSNEPIDRDTFGVPITNSSLETFDPPITEDVDDLVLRIEKNQEYFNSQLAADFKGMVNSDYFWGFPPGTCKLKIFDGVKARAGGLWYWQVTYEIHIRYDAYNDLKTGWKRRVLDQGFRVKTGATNNDGSPQFETCKDSNGNPLSQPTLLDGFGLRLTDGADPIFLEFETYGSRQFWELGL